MMKTILICMLMVSMSAFAGQYHVTTTGTNGGAGTIASPWSLFRSSNAALGFTPMPTGGDTVWIHGGIYNHTSTWDVACPGGTRTNPIIFRNWNNERVQIVVNNGSAGWNISLGAGGIGEYNWIWGLEIWSNRNPAVENAGISMNVKGVRIINCYIHDADITGFNSQGVPGTHAYGNILNYNGRFYWAPTGEGPGYGFYAQNVEAGLERKYFNDNIIAFNWSWGSHFYTVGNTLDSIVFEGNAIYNNGLFWRYPNWGSQSIFTAPNPRNRYLQENNNVFYQGLERSGGGNYMGLYGGGFSSATITGNYFIGPSNALTLENDGGSNTITGNVFVGPTSGVVSGYPSNTFLSSWPSARADDIIVRKNAYESNRANIYVLNYNETATVSVNPNVNGTVLNSGDTYVIKDGLNYAGANVTSGTWTSGNITIPMTGLPTPLTPQLPPDGMGQYTMGWLTENGGPGGPPPHTAPRFATFVLIGSSSGQAAGRTLQFTR